MLALTHTAVSTPLALQSNISRFLDRWHMHATAPVGYSALKLSVDASSGIVTPSFCQEEGVELQDASSLDVAPYPLPYQDVVGIQYHLD